MAPVLLMRSLPARSHSVSLPTVRTPVVRLLPTTLMMSRQCERDECALICTPQGPALVVCAYLRATSLCICVFIACQHSTPALLSHVVCIYLHIAPTVTAALDSRMTTCIGSHSLLVHGA